MKTKAAIAWKSGAPLTIEEVDLEGPRSDQRRLRSDEEGRVDSLGRSVLRSR